jgi:hypothetical protein
MNVMPGGQEDLPALKSLALAQQIAIRQRVSLLRQQFVLHKGSACSRATPAR